MSLNRKIQIEKESNFWGDVAFRYLPYWPMFLILFVIFLGAAFTYIRLTTPLYLSSARILIKDEKKGAEESKTLESLDALSTKKIIENETEVIQSKSLLDLVVKKLDLYAPVLEEKRFKTVSAYNSSPIRIHAENPDKIKEVKKIYFQFNDNKVIVNGTSYPLNEYVNTKYGRLKFLVNDRFENKVAKTGKLYFSLSKPKSVSGSIAGNLKVSAVNKLSTILDLAYLDEVPERGEDILNELLITYNEATIQDKNNLAANTLNFIEDRLKTVQHDLDSIEHKIQKYKSTRGAIDIGTEGRLFLQNVSNNDQKLSEINMQLSVLNQIDKYVQTNEKANEIVPSSLGVSDPTLSRLTERLYTLELDYESQKKTLGANNPVLVSVADQIQRTKQSISDNIRSQKTSLLASKNNLSSTNNSYSSQLRSIPEKERELIDINREQGIKNEIYTFLLQKREETALSHASIVSDSKIVDKARSTDSPVSPKKKIVYLLSVILALFTGIGVVLAKETFTQKIMFRQQIEGLTDKRVIGELVSQTTNSPIVIGDGTRTLIAEQFRKIRVTLNHLGIDSIKGKRVLVTSSISGEGKSFVATNLALSIAMTGKKVVLLDFDLNNPSLHEKINIKNKKGITEYLLGECEETEIIEPTELNKNLYIITTGVLPKNPSELLMDDSVKRLLDSLDLLFDYVIIDTAPVGPVTDAYILSPLCDTTLYIIRHNYTPKSFIERLDINNELNKLNNLVLVFNGLTSRGFGKNNYGYGYGYEGGYAYGSAKGNHKRLPASN